MPENIKISVAMSTYNGEKFLGQQLQSIVDQTLLPTQIVICDDCSKDSTKSIIRDFAASAPFEVKLIENAVNIGSTKRGITGNFETSVKQCSGDYIALCDQDDSWVPEKLASLIGLMEKNKELGGAFSDARLIDQQSVPTGVLLNQTTGFTAVERGWLHEGQALRVLLSMNKVYGCTLVFRAKLLEKILPIPMTWTHDNWIACMVAVYSELGFVPEPLISYRIHASQFYGAHVPSLKERLKHWKDSPSQYWEESQPRLLSFQERLDLLNDAETLPSRQYIRGRMDLLEKRNGLPKNRLLRLKAVLPEVANYHRYFNGWRSVVKDLTY
jgi:glycosyltransferase involved in cell wall biosynthesis